MPLHYPLTEKALQFSINAFFKINEQEKSLLNSGLTGIQNTINQLKDSETFDENGSQLKYSFHRHIGVYGDYVLTVGLSYVCKFDKNYLERECKKFPKIN